MAAQTKPVAIQKVKTIREKYHITPQLILTFVAPGVGVGALGVFNTKC